MIIYGTGERKLTTPTQTIKSQCPECGDYEVTFHFFKKYFHLFWIPVFPFDSRKVAQCRKCNAAYQESIPPSLQLEMENAKSRTSTPWYLFSGSGLIVIAILSIYLLDDGITTHYYPSRKKQASGRYVGDKPDGKWTYWYENGKIQSEQYFIKGKEDSTWVWYNEEGVKVKEGGYRNGYYQGKWSFYYPSGQLEAEDFYEENRKQGKASSYYESGHPAALGNFTRDREDGDWVYWYDNGNKMMEGIFSNGVKTGIWKSYFTDGKLNEETRYTDSMSYVMSYYDMDGRQLVINGNGVYTTWHGNGQKSSEGKVRNGLNEGLWNYWYEDGKPRESGVFSKGEYTLSDTWDLSGKPAVRQGNGYYKSFHGNGVVAFEGTYKNGKPHGLFVTRNADNVTVMEVNYNQGKYYGAFKQYLDTGELLSEGFFQNGVQVGEWSWYHANGKKEAQVMFTQGKKEGEEIFWSESGAIVKREFYEKGELKKEELY